MDLDYKRDMDQIKRRLRRIQILLRSIFTILLVWFGYWAIAQTSINAYIPPSAPIAIILILILKNWLFGFFDSVDYTEFE